MSVYQNINGTLARMDASDLAQLAAVDTEGILGGTPGATTNGQTLVDQLAADDVQAQTDIGQIKTDLTDYHVVPSRNKMQHVNASRSVASVTYNLNSDLSYTANGTATGGNSWYNIWKSGFTLPAGDYVLANGQNPLNSADGKLRTSIRMSDGTYLSISLGADHLDVTLSANYQIVEWSIGVANGTQASNYLFQPMIYTAADYAADPSYEPYFLPMRDGKLDIADEQVLGAWNMLDNRLTTQTNSGITVTVGSKKEVRVTTGSSAPTQLVNFRILPEKIGLGNLVVGKTYYLTGCPVGGLGGIYCLVIGRDHTGGSFDTLVDSGDGLQFTYDGSWTCRYVLLQIGTPVGANFDKTFYPMITTKKGAPYVPYTMTNRELTDAPNWNSTNAIANNTDLNDLKDGRRHFCQSGSTASTLTHCPVSVAFVLDVIIFNSDASAFLQILQPIDGDKMFKRNYASGAWGSWYKFTGTAV